MHACTHSMCSRASSPTHTAGTHCTRAILASCTPHARSSSNGSSRSHQTCCASDIRHIYSFRVSPCDRPSKAPLPATPSGSPVAPKPFRLPCECLRPRPCAHLSLHASGLGNPALMRPPRSVVTALAKLADKQAPCAPSEVARTLMRGRDLPADCSGPGAAAVLRREPIRDDHSESEVPLV